MREKLIELLKRGGEAFPVSMADHLLANGVTILKWIPVTERLPEIEMCRYSVDVLFYVEEDGIESGYFNFADRTWTIAGGWDHYTENEVTHWMPLARRRRRMLNNYDQQWKE